MYQTDCQSDKDRWTDRQTNEQMDRLEFTQGTNN